LTAASRYAARTACYPSPYEDPTGFVEWAREFLARERIQVALPITEVTTDLLLRHRSLWPNVLLPFAPIATIDALSDKVALYERALTLGIPVPRSVVVHSAADLAKAIAEIGFPAVLKPARSRIRRGNRFLSTSVVRVDDPDEALRQAAMPAFSASPYLFQGLVAGEGNGVFALYNHGQAMGFFAHRRLREKPPQGGVSVLSESCSPAPESLLLAKKLLDDAAWHGIAMVEFKGRYLMEVNARCWGSLQLAIDAGADFPRLLIEQAINGTASEIGEYRKGVRLRWLLGDLDRLYLVMRHRNPRESLPELGRFLRPSSCNTRHEVFRWNDPWPAFREAQQYLSALLRR
jgi:predicted ATP-grasp superfamily ATP-dependent carboligase